MTEIERNVVSFFAIFLMGRERWRKWKNRMKDWREKKKKKKKKKKARW